MRSLRYALSEYINECYHIPLVDKNNLKLIEEKNATFVNFKLKDRDFDNLFCFSIDKEKSVNTDCAVGNKVFPFFNAKIEGLCVKNDFILVYQLGNKIIVFLIELKSKHQKGFYAQLKTGQLFFQFVIEKIKLCNPDFHNIPYAIEYKAILFREPRKIPAESVSRHATPSFSKYTFTSVTEITDFLIAYQNINETYHLSQFV